VFLLTQSEKYLLLTEAARTRVKEYSFEEFPLTVSGVTMNAFRLVAS
jgi:hypothetical protein